MVMIIELLSNSLQAESCEIQFLEQQGSSAREVIVVMLVRQAGLTGLGHSSGDNLLRFHGVCCEALSVIERKGDIRLFGRRSACMVCMLV